MFFGIGNGAWYWDVLVFGIIVLLAYVLLNGQLTAT